MRAPLEWLRRYVALPAELAVDDIAQALVRIHDEVREEAWARLAQPHGHPRESERPALAVDEAAQPRVVLAQQRVQDPGRQRALAFGRVIVHACSARKRAMAVSTPCASGPIARIVPR